MFPLKYFNSKNTPEIAKNLIGKFLVREIGDKTIKSIITEVEAYDGPNDLASHASKGITERNKIMFGLAGYWYVYFVYGNHFMLNIVTGPKDYPAAILIRGVEDVNGPGRLTKFFKIDKKFNGAPANKKTGLYIADSKIEIKKSQIESAPRIGVAYAGPIWVSKPFRFFLN